MKIVSSKFLEFAVDILREDEKVFDYVMVKKADLLKKDDTTEKESKVPSDDPADKYQIIDIQASQS